MNSMLVLLEQAADVVCPYETIRFALCVFHAARIVFGGGLELTYFLFLSICWCRLSALIYFNLLLLFFLRESSLYVRCVVVFPAACESLIVIWQPRSDIFGGGGGLVHLRGKHLDLVSDLFHLIWMRACARFTVVVTHLYCRWHGWSDMLLWGETIRSLPMSSEWSLQ